MNRTKDRALPSGKIVTYEAYILGIILFTGSFVLLKINLLTYGIALATMLIYVFVYTPMKQVSWLNTLVGAVPEPFLYWVAGLLVVRRFILLEYH